MWPWLKTLFHRKKPQAASSQDSVRLSDEGIYYLSWLSRAQQWPTLWPWPLVCEFGLSVQQAIYPDPWFGDYMEAQWFFTVEQESGAQRFFFDIDYFSIDNLPASLIEKLPGFDAAAFNEGRKQYRARLRNLKAEGHWLAWQKPGFNWPVGACTETNKI